MEWDDVRSSTLCDSNGIIRGFESIYFFYVLNMFVVKVERF